MPRMLSTVGDKLQKASTHVDCVVHYEDIFFLDERARIRLAETGLLPSMTNAHRSLCLSATHRTPPCGCGCKEENMDVV